MAVCASVYRGTMKSFGRFSSWIIRRSRLRIRQIEGKLIGLEAGPVGVARCVEGRDRCRHAPHAPRDEAPSIRVV